MRRSRTNLGTQSLPFPDAKQSRALDDEDAFMIEHDHWGARVIYLLVQALSFR